MSAFLISGKHLRIISAGIILLADCNDEVAEALRNVMHTTKAASNPFEELAKLMIEYNKKSIIAEYKHKPEIAESLLYEPVCFGNTTSHRGCQRYVFRDSEGEVRYRVEVLLDTNTRDMVGIEVREDGCGCWTKYDAIQLLKLLECYEYQCDRMEWQGSALQQLIKAAQFRYMTIFTHSTPEWSNAAYAQIRVLCSVLFDSTHPEGSYAIGETPCFCPAGDRESTKAALKAEVVNDTAMSQLLQAVDTWMGEPDISNTTVFTISNPRDFHYGRVSNPATPRSKRGQRKRRWPHG